MEYIYSNRSNTINGLKRGNRIKLNKTKRIFKNIILILMIFILIIIGSNSISGKNNLTTRTIIVDSGTTLWNIANNVCEDNPELNVKNVIIDIKELNNIKNSIIYENQKLLIYEY